MDLISKQNAIEASTESNLKSHMDSVEDELENCVDDEFIRLGETIDDEILNSYFRIRSIIMSQSSAQRRGKWIDEGQYAEGHSEYAYYCSQCEEHYIGWIGEFNYCPNCGARMGDEYDN
jgi:rubrerythrin